MAFHDVRFPEDIAYGSTGGPVFATDIVATRGGQEQRVSYWQQARARYNVSQGIQSASQMHELIGFFRARQGRAHSFRYKDWLDYSASNQPLGVDNGSETSFQLIRRYSSGSSNHDRPIRKPVNGSVTIYEDGTPQAAVTIDNDTGIVTFDSAPANAVVLTADFEFDVPVRFDTDQLAASLDGSNIRSWGNIELVEVL